jgi:DNA-binding MarR family transcriptional regulator
MGMRAMPERAYQKRGEQYLLAELLDVTHQTASALVREFETRNILEAGPQIERSRSFVFRRYVDLFRP